MSEATADIESSLAHIDVFEATVSEAWWDRPDYRRIRVTFERHPLLETYRIPGQFVAMGAPGTEPRFFAIASTPNELPTAEFLVGKGHETSDGLSRLKPGDSVCVSAAMGAGYRMPEIERQEAVFFATGTGIAAVRPVIRTLMGRAQAVHVYIGEDATCRFGFEDEFDEWRTHGVVLHEVCDSSGPLRFVQDAYRADPAALNSESTQYVICGSDPMQRAVVALLTERGVDAARMHFNY